MSNWTPTLILPNLNTKSGLGDESIMLVSALDDRLKSARTLQPKLSLFFDCFSDEFGERVTPSVLIIRNESSDGYRSTSAVAGFRDLVAVSGLTMNRARRLTGQGAFGAPLWADNFQFYPWMVDRHGEGLVVQTPASLGTGFVEPFRGQITPGIRHTSLSVSDIDRPLFRELLKRWHRRFGGAEVLHEDRVLFRSLNAAFHSMLMPAGTELSFYDVGRSLALWISAFEILMHESPTDKRVSEKRVLNLLDGVAWKDENLISKRDQGKSRNSTGDRSRASQLYHAVYRLRHDFLHGNEVSIAQMSTANGVEYHQLVGSIYRMVLAERLGLRPPERPAISETDIEQAAKLLNERMSWSDPQLLHEKVLLKANA